MFDLFESQPSLAFPLSLTEKYRPRTIGDFAGLAKPKAIIGKLAAHPFEFAPQLCNPSTVPRYQCLAAAYLCAEVGISNESLETNQVAYIQGWMKALKNDRTLLVSAAQKAQRAADLILDRVPAQAAEEQNLAA